MKKYSVLLGLFMVLAAFAAVITMPQNVEARKVSWGYFDNVVASSVTVSYGISGSSLTLRQTEADASTLQAFTKNSGKFKFGEETDVAVEGTVVLSTDWGTKGVIFGSTTSGALAETCIWSIEGTSAKVNAIHDSGACGTSNTSDKLSVVSDGAGVYHLHNGFTWVANVLLLYFGW